MNLLVCVCMFAFAKGVWWAVGACIHFSVWYRQGAKAQKMLRLEACLMYLGIPIGIYVCVPARGKESKKEMCV